MNIVSILNIDHSWKYEVKIQIYKINVRKYNQNFPPLMEIVASDGVVSFSQLFRVLDLFLSLKFFESWPTVLIASVPPHLAEAVFSVQFSIVQTIYIITIITNLLRLLKWRGEQFIYSYYSKLFGKLGSTTSNWRRPQFSLCLENFIITFSVTPKLLKNSWKVY